MPYIYPHTNLNQQNLDWLIGQIKELHDLISSMVITGAGNLSIVFSYNDMTDHNVLYFFLGTDTVSPPRVIYGHLYQWSGTAWTDKGMITPSYPLSITEGGTNAQNAADARTFLDITPQNIGAEPAFTTLQVSRGGTGASTAAGAITNLGITAAAIGAEPTITKLPISKGGTNASTAAAARTNLGAQAALTSSNPLEVSKGGTGASTAAGALTNLGAEPAISTLPISKGGTGADNAASARSSLHALGSSDIAYEQHDGSTTSVAAGATDHVELDASKSGYTLLGIVSYFGSGTSNFQWTDIYFSGDTVYMYFKNTTNSTQSITPKCRCIYVKTV